MIDSLVNFAAGLSLCPIFVSIYRAISRPSLSYTIVSVFLMLLYTIIVIAFDEAPVAFVTGATLGIVCSMVCLYREGAYGSGH